jgi:hypothetical protein
MEKLLTIILFSLISLNELIACKINKIDSVEIYAVSFNLLREFPIRRWEIKKEATAHIVIKDTNDLGRIMKSLDEFSTSTNNTVKDIRFLCIMHYSNLKKSKMYISFYRDIEWRRKKFKNDVFLKEILKFLPEQYTPFEFHL